MTINNDSTPISQFILESEKNVEIATFIYENYDNARAELVKGFIERLEADLKGRLPDWSFEYDPPFFTSRYGILFLKKAKWLDCYAIVLEAFDEGNQMNYGVWRDETLIGAVPRNPELLAEVRKRLPQARSRKYYEAEIQMNSPAPDWRKPKVLWRMQTDETFRKEVAASLLEIVEIAEKRIGDLVKSLPKSNHPVMSGA